MNTYAQPYLVTLLADFIATNVPNDATLTTLCALLSQLSAALASIIALRAQTAPADADADTATYPY